MQTSSSVGLFSDGTVTSDALDSTYLPSTTNVDQTPTTHGNWGDTDTGVTAPPESDVITILAYAAPPIILVLLILIIIFILKQKKRKKDKEDVPASEDVKSPIFEEDTPSVMEIEMDDLDKWMNYMKKSSSRMSTLEEESKFQTRYFGEKELSRTMQNIRQVLNPDGCS